MSRKRSQKNFKKVVVKKNINFLINLIKENKFKKYFKLYVKELKNISQRFNLRLKREEKSLFCKKCLNKLSSKENTLLIRFDSKTKTKNYICKNCGFVKRFKYK